MQFGSQMSLLLLLWMNMRSPIACLLRVSPAGWWGCRVCDIPSSSRTFSLCRTGTPYPLNNNSSFLLPQSLARTLLLSVSMKLTTLGASYKWIKEYLSFCELLISLSSRFIHVASQFPISFFLRLNNIPLNEYTTFVYLFIHQRTLGLPPPFYYYE